MSTLFRGTNAGFVLIFDTFSLHFTVLSFILPPMANTRDESVITTEQSRPKVLSTEKFTCPLCSSILTSRSHFLHHVGTEHGESIFAVCKTCMQCFSPKEIDSHMTACKGSFVCPYCRQTFALLPYLNRHIRRKHSIDDENRAPSSAGNGPRYPCKFCSKTYSSNNSLNDHIRKHLNCVCKLCGSRLICKSKKDFATCGACGTLMSLDHGEGVGGDEDGKEVGGMDGGKDVVGTPNTITTVTTAEAGRMPQFTCPYCQRLYVSLTYFRKHLAAHAPSHSTATTVSSTPAGTVATKSALTTDCSTGSTADFCEMFTEEDWMQADSYLCLSPTPNISLLHSILYEGASTEFL
ncbi:Zinc finger protein 77 [Taenia crassiceps]|uniref:Zinc finger protein 77 n=1 Tax=Taenia crassiceps TaxID=6207 RepID=A0ABR4Q179_9CEST